MKRRKVIVNVQSHKSKKNKNPLLLGSILFVLLCCGILRGGDDGEDSVTPTVERFSQGGSVVIITYSPTATQIMTRTSVPTLTRTRVSTWTPNPEITPLRISTKPPPTSTQVVIAPAPTQQANNNCSPAYPSVCIPSAPPDLNCPDIPYRNFTVLPPDPHGFDRNNDGVGCEE